MKSATAFALLGALVPVVTAHYTFPSITVGGAKSADWQYIRTTANHYSNGPVTDVTSDAIRCYELSPGTPSSTVTVSAGSSVTVTANTGIYHQGTIAIYMAAASDASSASAGKGQSWFKIYQNVPVWNSGSRQFTFPSTTDATITFTIPKDVPSGQYLLRTEQIALHQASAAGGAQFYISCAQLNVVNGGSGTPGPLVSFPGAYSATDPGIMINIYNPPAGYSGYTPPGPKVWTGGSYSGGGGQPSNTATSTTATQPASTATATSSTATSAPTSGSGGAAQWAQCGGTGWSGATSCASPYKCVTLNQYYSQCQ